jgi:hypothetical protein
VWLGTNKGLSRFNPASESFTNYDSNDGLQSNEFNSGAFFRRADGRLLFGGMNAYLGKDFVAAVSCFKAVLNVDPQDKAARLSNRLFILNGYPLSSTKAHVLQPASLLISPATLSTIVINLSLHRN